MTPSLHISYLDFCTLQQARPQLQVVLVGNASDSQVCVPSAPGLLLLCLHDNRVRAGADQALIHCHTPICKKGVSALFFRLQGQQQAQNIPWHTWSAVLRQMKCYSNGDTSHKSVNPTIFSLKIFPLHKIATNRWQMAFNVHKKL